jgi:hypothetical protein
MVVLVFGSGFMVQASNNKKPETINQKPIARAERFELPSTVLETAILPLNYARMKAKSYPRCGIALSYMLQI